MLHPWKKSGLEKIGNLKKYVLKINVAHGDSRQIPHVKTKSMPVKKYKKFAYEIGKLHVKKPAHKFWKTDFVTQTPIKPSRPGQGAKSGVFS